MFPTIPGLNLYNCTSSEINVSSFNPSSQLTQTVSQSQHIPSPSPGPPIINYNICNYNGSFFSYYGHGYNQYNQYNNSHRLQMKTDHDDSDDQDVDLFSKTKILRTRPPSIAVNDNNTDNNRFSNNLGDNDKMHIWPDNVMRLWRKI